jgi:hypothetical protein
MTRWQLASQRRMNRIMLVTELKLVLWVCGLECWSRIDFVAVHRRNDAFLVEDELCTPR